MKKKYTITLDAERFEEFKKYVSNVSGFFNQTISRYVIYRKKTEKILKKQELTQQDIDELKTAIEIANVPWTN